MGRRVMPPIQRGPLHRMRWNPRPARRRKARAPRSAKAWDRGRAGGWPADRARDGSRLPLRESRPATSRASAAPNARSAPVSRESGMPRKWLGPASVMRSRRAPPRGAPFPAVHSVHAETPRRATFGDYGSIMSLRGRPFGLRPRCGTVSRQLRLPTAPTKGAAAPLETPADDHSSSGFAQPFSSGSV